MQVVFDGTATPYGIEPFSLFGLIPLGICLIGRFVRHRGWSWMLLAIAAVALIGINGIRNGPVRPDEQPPESSRLDAKGSRIFIRLRSCINEAVRSVACARTIRDLHAAVLQFAHPVGGGNPLVGLAERLAGD